MKRRSERSHYVNAPEILTRRPRSCSPRATAFPFSGQSRGLRASRFPSTGDGASTTQPNPLTFRTLKPLQRLLSITDSVAPPPHPRPRPVPHGAPKALGWFGGRESVDRRITGQN